MKNIYCKVCLLNIPTMKEWTMMKWSIISGSINV